MRFALRSLFRTPGFTVVAVLTLALGIGLNTAMFSVANTFLLQPLPFPQPDQLFRVLRTSQSERSSRNYGHAGANVQDIRRAASEFAEVAAFRNWGFTLSDPPQPAEVLNSYRISANFFSTLGVTPELGRAFLPEEEEPGRNNVIILSHDYWMSRFRGDASVIGRIVRIDGHPTEIVGVLPAGVTANSMLARISLYRPLTLSVDEATSRTQNDIELIARPAPGISPAQMETRFAALAAQLAAEHPKENVELGLRILPLSSTGVDDTGRQITFMLVALSGFVLLIACANLANLLLARAIGRAREFAIRGALGASRTQLIRPLAAECGLLAFLGGAGAILVAVWTNDWMEARLGGGSDTPLEFAIDARVLLFTLLVALATAFLFGVVPAWLVSRIRVNDALKSGARGSTGGRSHHRFRQALIIGQFSLALVLLAGAGYFIRGLEHLIGTRAGWDPTALVRGIVSLPSSKYADPDQMMRFYNEALRRLSELPGVESAAASYELPLFRFTGPRQYEVEGRPTAVAGQEPPAFVNGITPGYFKTSGTRLLRGRDFLETDDTNAPQVLIINESMARALFPGEDPIGRRLVQKGGGTKEIVGVVEDVRFLNIAPSPVRFQVYQPLAQETWGFVILTVRAPNVGTTLIEPFRRAIAELDPELPVMNLNPVPTVILRSTDDLQMIRQLLTTFAILGLFLAGLGIYSVIARIVAQRTGEIGIRMALGAQLQDVVRLILGAGLRMAVIGTVLGLIGAFVLLRFLGASLPGLAGNSWLAVAMAGGILLVIALVACWIPARRAGRIDPLVALRSE